MKLLVYRTEKSLDAVLVFIDDTQTPADADKEILDDRSFSGYYRVAELDVRGDHEELYTLHPYEG